MISNLTYYQLTCPIRVGAITLWVAIALFLFVANPSWAAGNSAAVAVETKGNIEAKPPGAIAYRKLRSGDGIDSGSFIRTLDGSSVTIVFEDSHAVYVGTNSEIHIEKYVFSKSTPQISEVKIALREGVIRSRSGIIGRVWPQNVRYQAGGIRVDIRGTEIVAILRQGSALFSVISGEIGLSSSQTVVLRAGRSALFASNTGLFDVSDTPVLISRIRGKHNNLVLDLITSIAHEFPEIRWTDSPMYSTATGVGGAAGVGAGFWPRCDHAARSCPTSRPTAMRSAAAADIR